MSLWYRTKGESRESWWANIGPDVRGGVALSGCEVDDEPDPLVGGNDATDEEFVDGTVEIVGLDDAFEGVPKSVEVGTDLTFVNESSGGPTSRS